ncbi:hypothetical protein QUF72_14150 [Desulfobacterales bacterium HSG2]|nr:hypothetical protein [Desulfobacterales bacterium HSG2]
MLSAVSAGLNEFVHPNPAISDFIKGAGFFRMFLRDRKRVKKKPGFLGNPVSVRIMCERAGKFVTREPYGSGGMIRIE